MLIPKDVSEPENLKTGPRPVRIGQFGPVFEKKMVVNFRFGSVIIFFGPVPVFIFPFFLGPIRTECYFF